MRKKREKKQRQLFRKQGRDDDDELLSSSLVTNKIRSSILATIDDEDGNRKIEADSDESIEVEELVFFNTLTWAAHSLPFLQEESIDERGNENKNDDNDNENDNEKNDYSNPEVEGDEGYQEDRELGQEQHPDQGGDEENGRAHKRKHTMKKRSTITTPGKTAHEMESPIVE